MAIVLGGGIGGLAAAHYLLRKLPANNVKINLFESSSRCGGWISSETPTNTNIGDNATVFERGPRTLRPHGLKGYNTLDLCSELKLHDVLMPIKSTHPAAKNRMLYVNGELYPLPSSLLSIFKKMPPFSKPLIFAAKQDLETEAAKGLTDDTIYNFAERRFGTDVAKYAISAMMCGICAGDAKEISVKFLMKELFELEQQYGSVLRGIVLKTFGGNKNSSAEPKSDLAKRAQEEKWSIYTIKGGMERFVDALADHLKRNNVELFMNSKCDNIEFTNDGALVGVGSEQYSTDCLISSLPAYQLGKLVAKQHPQLANELNAIHYVDVGVVNLQYSGELLPKPAFGFLVPPCENSKILGVIYDSCCMDIKGKTVLTVMMGGKWYSERLGKPSDDDLLNIAINQVENILKISEKPEAFKVNVLHQCIPQYVVGHTDRIERIRHYIRDHDLPLRLCGSAYEGVGVNDVIYSAKQAVFD